VQCYRFSSSSRKNVVERIVLVGIPSLTTIAKMGWGGLKMFNDEKFWQSQLSRAARASPRDSSLLFSLPQERRRSHNWLLE